MRYVLFFLFVVGLFVILAFGSPYSEFEIRAMVDDAAVAQHLLRAAQWDSRELHDFAALLSKHWPFEKSVARDFLHRRARIIALHLGQLRELWCIVGLTWVAVGALGLARREASRRGAVFSSSTCTRLGFYGFWVAVTAFVTYLLSGLPLWFVYLPFAIAALSIYLYVGNLPCRM